MEEEEEVQGRSGRSRDRGGEQCRLRRTFANDTHNQVFKALRNIGNRGFNQATPASARGSDGVFNVDIDERSKFINPMVTKLRQAKEKPQ